MCGKSIFPACLILALGVINVANGNQDGITGGYKLGVYDDVLEFEIRTADNAAFLNKSVAVGTLLEPEVWYHVVGVYSQGDYIRTYVDGNVDREMFTADLLGTSTGTFKLGREPFSDSYFWLGLMDDVRVYDRALRQEEIQAIMRAEESPFASNPYPADGVTLVGPAVTLSWTAGFGAIMHTVYFVDDFDTVNNAAGGAPQILTTYKESLASL